MHEEVAKTDLNASLAAGKMVLGEGGSAAGAGGSPLASGWIISNAEVVRAFGQGKASPTFSGSFDTDTKCVAAGLRR